MGKGPSKLKAVPLPLTVPKPLFEYLTWLARNSTLGSRETEVATYILKEAVARMIRDKDHDLTFPRDSGGTDLEEADVALD